MYATKTKKIVSYGRRGQRVVPAHDDRQSLKSQNKEDRASEQSTQLDVYGEYSPRINRISRRNFGSLNSSPVKDKQTYTEFDNASAIKTKIQGPMKSSRKILGDYPTNVPGSPAISPKRSVKYQLVGKGTPVARRPFSPYTDVEIVVNDEHGRRLSQEKRIIKPKVQVNLVGNSAVRKASEKMPKGAKKKLHSTISTRARRRPSVISLTSDSSEDEYIANQAKTSKEPRKVINGTRNNNYRHIVISDSDKSDFESYTQRVSKQPVTRKFRNRGIVVSSDSENTPRLRSLVEFARVGNRRGSPDSPARNLQDVNGTVTRVISSNAKEKTNIMPIEVIIPRISASSVSSYIPLEQYVKQSTFASGNSPIHNATSSQTPPSSPKLLACKANQSPRPITVTPHPNFARTKPRIATPFRGGQNRLFFQHTHNAVPSTPSEMGTDLDDTLQEIEKMMLTVSIQSSLATQQLYLPDYAEKSCRSKEDKLISQQMTQSHLSDLSSPIYLQPLLSECNQQAPYDFEEFVQTFSVKYAHLLSESAPKTSKSSKQRAKPSFNKIGEASYSEVFGIGDIVLKVIPLRDEENQASSSSPNADVVDEPFLSDAKDVLKEIIVTRSMGETCPGFIRLLSVHVVKGKYPASLLNLWDEYNERKGSEGVRPETFGPSQNYIIIILPNGGPDLEALSFTTSSPRSGWRQACSIFWQITRSLSMAEELVRFEHRDLHWGQILVKQQVIAKTRSNARKNSDVSDTQESIKLFLDDPAHGVQATIIDFGLARVDKVTKEKESGETTYWTNVDPMIFEGEGDYQFDVYRMMKEHNGDSWEEYRPLTNVMWLHYLSLKLLHAKRLRIPAARSSRKNNTTNPSAEQEIEFRCYRCLIEVEKKLAKVLSKIPRKQIKSDVKRSDTAVGFNRAGDVLLFGQAKGWVR